MPPHRGRHLPLQFAQTQLSQQHLSQQMHSSPWLQLHLLQQLGVQSPHPTTNVKANIANKAYKIFIFFS